MKRIYNPKGHSAPAWVVMTVLILAFVPFNAWIVIRCVGGGLRKAWIEMRGTVADLKKAWNSAR